MRAPRVGVVVVCGAVMAIAVAGASASTLVGSKAANLLVGTRGSDKLNGKAGNDTLRGKAGDDVLKGGRGADTLVGGPGADRIFGGPGNDVIRASDGRADRLVDGGGGVNTCIVDIPADLSATVDCGSIQAGSAQGGGGGNGADLLSITSAQGLTCLPVGLGCLFTITGDGADALVGNVTASGAVTSVSNAAVNGVVTGTWLATGTYQCAGSGDGFLVVHIGSKSTPQIPVTCG